MRSRMYSLIESKARASESARANSANSGFNEILIVTAFIRCKTSNDGKPGQTLPIARQDSRIRKGGLRTTKKLVDMIFGRVYSGATNCLIGRTQIAIWNLDGAKK